MTPEYRLTLIIETIRAIRIGAPVSKGGVTLLPVSYTHLTLPTNREV